MKILDASHTDHVTPAILAWVAERFADRDAFFIESVELPEEMGSVECGLYGPAMGDEPVRDRSAFERKREGRDWASRCVARPMRQTQTLTVIAGPAGDKPCVLYTVYGGPAAPRGPNDPHIESEEEREASKAFWAEHALSAPTKRYRVVLYLIETPDRDGKFPDAATVAMGVEYDLKYAWTQSGAHNDPSHTRLGLEETTAEEVS